MDVAKDFMGNDEKVPSNVVDLNNIQRAISIFDSLVRVTGNRVVEDEALVSIVLSGIDALDEKELNILTSHFRSELSKYSATPLSRSRIEGIIVDFLARGGTAWLGHRFVGEDNGSLYVIEKKEKVYISNFVLIPRSTVVVQGKNGKKYHNYDLCVKGSAKTRNIMLTADSFNKLSDLQEQLKEQAPDMSPRINGCANYMNDLGHKFIDLPEWGEEKQGTSLLGLEVLEDGKKYFCTPTTIYDMNGEESRDIVAMGNQQANQQELSNWSNLRHDNKSWSTIAKTFLEHILCINDLDEMLLLVGWMMAIPHDYVIRKESKTGYFPHCQIVGEPGAGKSTIMTLLKQYMGHNDSAPRAFPSSFEVGKLLNSSYTIPVVLDEYGKRWSPELVEAINRILVECFTRSYYSKGTANQSSVYYKHKNPILYGGQMPTKDKALSERIVDVRIRKSFQTSEEGTIAKKHLMELQKQKDKNFWVGYNIWCANHSNEYVLDRFTKYRKVSGMHIKDNRIADIYAVVMIGIHFMKKLADELNVPLDITEKDISQIAERMSLSSKMEEIEESNMLKQFLNDVAQFGIRHGNNAYHGNNFGPRSTVTKVITTKSPADPGMYGDMKSPACIYGNDLLLIKVKEMVGVLNKGLRSPLYLEEELMVFIESDFRLSLKNSENEDNRSNNLVLAPKSYRTRSGRYTAFNWNVIKTEYPEFEIILDTNSTDKEKD